MGNSIDRWHQHETSAQQVKSPYRRLMHHCNVRAPFERITSDRMKDHYGHIAHCTGFKEGDQVLLHYLIHASGCYLSCIAREAERGV
jgi:hypothetical protein